MPSPHLKEIYDVGLDQWIVELKVGDFECFVAVVDGVPNLLFSKAEDPIRMVPWEHIQDGLRMAVKRLNAID